MSVSSYYTCTNKNIAKTSISETKHYIAAQKRNINNVTPPGQGTRNMLAVETFSDMPLKATKVGEGVP